MQYSPKLKTAMAEIKSILQKHDIAGFVLIHDPRGFVEYLNHIDPSYSCAVIQDGTFDIKLIVDPLPGGSDKAHHMAADTYNMVALMTDMLVYHTCGYMDFRNALKKQWDGSESGGLHTGHNQQNN